MKFTSQGKAAIETLLRCMREANAAFQSLNAVENKACLDFHGEGSSLNHCTRWGLSAAEEIHAEVVGQDLQKTATGNHQQQKQMLQIGNFEVNASVDDDGHLTLWVKSTDGSPAMDIGEDIAMSDDEFAVRLTTQEIERQYNAPSSDAERQQA